MKNKKLLPLLLVPAAVLTMTGCSKIEARPSDYSEEHRLISRNDGSEIDVYNNFMKVIYDAKLESGAVSSQVLDEVLLQISNIIFGSYADTKVGEENVPGLKTIAGYIAKADRSQAEKDAIAKFIADHKVYTPEEKEGMSDADKTKRAEKRVSNRFEDVENRIAKKLFATVSSGSYTRNDIFYEEDYLMSLVNTIKDVKNPNEETLELNKVLILPEFDENDLFDKILHKEYIEGYINHDIVPGIYRELLVEQYLFESNYSALGRSYARDVNIITINKRNEHPLAADKLINAYIDNYINVANPAENNGFDIISQAWRGVDLTNEATNLLNAAGFAKQTYVDANGFTNNAEYTYYEGTSYGDMVEDLKEVVTDEKKTDSAKENEFTNNGEYTVAQGIEVKENKISKENYITDGWSVRSSGLSNVNDNIKKRLFHISVSNALDNPNYPDRFNEAGEYTNNPVIKDGDVEYKENNYVAKINGRYFLKTDTSERNNDDKAKLKDMLWIDQASGSYTLVEINRAVSSSKLAINGDENYEAIYGKDDAFKGFEVMEEISHDVAEELAKSDSYRTLSTKYWLEAAAMTFHDETILKYFQDNYPDIFEK